MAQLGKSQLEAALAAFGVEHDGTSIEVYAEVKDNAGKSHSIRAKAYKVELLQSEGEPAKLVISSNDGAES